jgi:hypothetical protein
LDTEREVNGGEPSESSMAEVLSAEFGVDVTRNAVHGKLYREVSKVVPQEVIFMPTYEKYKEQILDSSIKRKPSVSLDGKKKIVHIADLHIPFQNTKALYSAINLHVAADIVVMSEIMEISSQNPFDKAGAVPLEREIEETLKFFEVISAAFPTILIMESNHENRFKRQVVNRLPLEFQLLIQDVNILELLVRPFSNIFVIPSWWLQLGDAIFCHASHSSSVSMKAAVDVHDYFVRNAEIIGANPHRVLVQAHTHALGVVYLPDAKIFEAGCLCKLQDWYMGAKIGRKPLWSTACISVEMEDGKSNLNRTRETVFSSEFNRDDTLVV